MSILTKEVIQKILNDDWLLMDDCEGLENCTVIKELARMALAAMGSEPSRNPVLAYADSYRDMAKQGVESVPIWSVITDLERNIAPLYRHAQPAKGLELAGWQFKSVNGDWLGLIDEHGKNQAVREGCEVREVFAMADGVNDRDQVRSEHAEWSQATFGNVGPVGPLKHLSKEALEAAAEPDDLSEWADMQFLLWDAQRRAGITDEQITLAMIEKLAVNKQREWPEPKDGEPRLHIKEQPTPVVPDIDELRLAFEAAERESDDGFNLHKYGIGYADDETQGRWDTWLACRSAMLQGRQKSAGASNNGRSGENVQVMQDVSRCSTKAAPALDSPPKTAESRSGNSPVIPAGYVMVPKEPTAEMIWAAKYCFTSTPGWDVFKSAYIAMLAAAPQEVKGE